MLSLSIHREGPNTPQDKIFRAFLWDGRIPKLGDDTLMVAEFSNDNIFLCLEGLKAAALEWASRGGRNWKVAGIHTPASCWPLDHTTSPSLSIRELAIHTEQHLVQHQ